LTVLAIGCEVAPARPPPFTRKSGSAGNSLSSTRNIPTAKKLTLCVAEVLATHATHG